ncbi:MAG: ATP-binding protein [bacterium]|nr:ATP-binding protein [bacterium]
MRTVARLMQARIEESLDHFRVVVLHGARQCGKSTLARLVAEERRGTYAPLDNDAVRQAALEDPRGFLLQQAHPLVVDEIQLGGDRVVRALKQVVDADPAPGRFLLTGSTNFLTVPTISETLAGRIQLLRLWPLSQAEVAGTAPAGLGAWFEGSDAPARCAAPPRISRRDYLELACRGGYPEVLALPAHLRHDWFDSYTHTVVERDVLALGDLRRRDLLPTVLQWIAANTAREVNVQAAAGRVGLDRATFASYLAWMETVFFIHRLPSWSRNPSARAVRRPKMHVTDTGLAAGLLGFDADALDAPTAPATGPLLETFAVNEIARGLAASSERLRLYHYRDHRGRQIDLVIERPDGAVVAIEIKATGSPSADQLRHVGHLRDRLDETAPGAFRAGLLLHTGEEELTVGDRLHLRPIKTLWQNP